MMHRGSVINNQGTQVICLPRSVRLPDGTASVDIVRQGHALIIVPSQDSWAQWFEEDGVDDDFMATRDQPDADRRGL